MNVRWKATFAAVLGLAAAGWPTCRAQDPAWLPSYAEGQAAARTSGKPVFVVFRCER